MPRILRVSAQLIVSMLVLGSVDAEQPKPEGPDQKPRMIDFADPVYGARIRQVYNPTGDEHNLYHYRSVFNADNSRPLTGEGKDRNAGRI